MFDNIGKKIKSLANVLCWVGIIAYVIAAIAMFVIAADNPWDAEHYVPIGFAFLIVGPLSSWISSFFMYGFGELIDKACEIEENTRSYERESILQAQIETERIDKIEKLYSQGLITEEEYQQAISK